MILLGMGILLFLMPHISASASGRTFRDADAFYDTYGSGQIIFADGAFYYSSRGKAGDPQGIRYGVSGQKFTMQIDGGKQYVIDIALDDGSGSGSCRRISYVKKNGYYYSLYQISYDRIFKRLQSRYPGTDFGRMMYNHRIRFQIDFYLCLVMNGKDQGMITELDNGQADFTGTVYRNLGQILKAASWSQSTREALKNYYGIQLTVFQPSVWYISYHKNDPAALGTMEKQKFIYGKAGKLETCRFSKIITVTLDPGEVLWKGEKLQPVHTMLKSSFRGWGLTKKGPVTYSGGAEVKNLTDEHNGVISLYALWSDQTYELPGMNSDQYIFLGWSREKMEVLSADAGEEEVRKLKLYESGSSLVLKKDTELYAVWKEKRYRVEFRTPQEDEKDGGADGKIRYGREQIEQIRKLVEKCGFAGTLLNRELIRKGLV